MKGEKIRVAINGAGRIGRAFLKIALKREEIEIVAINDLGDIENIAYLLKYDTVYGVNSSTISVDAGAKKITVDSNEIVFLSEKDPAKLPWKHLAIDVVVESTGFFASYEKARTHITAGAKRIVISAPAKGDPKDETEGTILMGINEKKLRTCEVSSNASCTTNAGSPVIQILHETIGIEKAILNTVHAYTATQSIVDSPGSKDFRNGRAAAQNIIPASTGAAISTTEAITDLKGLFDGIAIRVPVLAGSIADITFISKRNTSAEEINTILRKASSEERWQNIFAVTEDPVVSSDILGSHYASIADLALTRVVGGNLVKVLAWYDNEMGYTYSLVDHVIKTGSFSKNK